MAKVRLNPVVQQVRGRVGDLVFRRHHNQTVVGQKADLAGREPTPSQAAQRERFRQATVYAKSVLADPERKVVYQTVAQTRKLGVFALSVGDYLNPPEVQAVDLSGYSGQAGESIRVTATDDVEVVGVQVHITDASGALVEEGQAVSQGGGTWIYTTTAQAPAGQAINVTATATDRPGNQTARTEVKS